MLISPFFVRDRLSPGTAVLVRGTKFVPKEHYPSEMVFVVFQNAFCILKNNGWAELFDHRIDGDEFVAGVRQHTVKPKSGHAGICTQENSLLYLNVLPSRVIISHYRLNVYCLPKSRLDLFFAKRWGERGNFII